MNGRSDRMIWAARSSVIAKSSWALGGLHRFPPGAVLARSSFESEDSELTSTV